MFDWTSFTQDPSDKETGKRFRAFLIGLQSFYSSSRNDFLRQYFKGARVLDIGAGEHNASCYHEERWEHGIICKVASHVLGIDINPSVCEHYNRKGFRFQCVDATSDADLGERFDRIFMGDVIEHVDNPIALARFAKRHLAPDGRILLSTPNPYYFAGLSARRRTVNRPFFMANFEHVSWITPTNANEIARRAGLTFSRLYFPNYSFASVRCPKTAVRALKSRLLRWMGLTELAHKEYMYEFTA
jgi:SAM-dependent methyltransferase